MKNEEIISNALITEGWNPNRGYQYESYVMKQLSMGLMIIAVSQRDSDRNCDGGSHGYGMKAGPSLETQVEHLNG